MINVNAYAYQSGIWVEIPGIYPLQICDRLDEELESGKFCFFGGQQRFKPMTMIKIVLSDDVETPQKVKYFYGTDSVEKVNSTTWKHTLSLVEPSKRLEGVKIDGRAVVQPEAVEDRLSLYAVLSDLLAITPLRVAGEDIPFKITTDTAVVEALSGVNSPEFRWDCQTTLWECLSDIGAYIDAMPRLAANANETAFDTITFDFINEVKAVIAALDEHKRSDAIEEYQYCSELETIASNVVATTEEEASVVFPGVGAWITPRCEDVKLDTENCEIILPSNIEKLLHVYLKVDAAELMCSYSIPLGGYSWLSLSDLGYNITEVDITHWIVEHKNWLTLETLVESDDAVGETLYKNNTFYWEQGKNSIKGMGEKYKSLLLFNQRAFITLYKSICLQLCPVQYTSKDKTLYTRAEVAPISGTDKADIRDWEFRVEYIPTGGTAKMKAVKTNYADTEFTQTYNQRAQVNNATLLGRNMRSTANKMGVDIVKILKTYSSLDGLLSIGDCYKENEDTYIVTNVDITLLSHHLMAVTYELSKNWSLLSRYVGIDRRFRSWNIPSETLVRNLYDCDYCVIERAANNVDSRCRITDEGKAIFYNVLLTDTQNNSEINNAFILSPIASSSLYFSGETGVALSCATLGTANSILAFAETKDNLSAGKKIDTDGLYCQDVYYCDADGRIENKKIVLASAFANESGATINSNVLPFCRHEESFELVDGQYVGPIVDDTNYYQSALIEGNYTIKKTPAEQLNYTYQLHLVTPLDDIVIGPKLTENNPLVKQHFGEKTFSVWGLTRPLPKGAVKVNTGFGSKNVSNTFTYTYNSESMYGSITGVTLADTPGTTYIGWAITDENDNLYIAQNSRNTESINFNLKHTYHG